MDAELELTPSREWPGKGLLGVTIRFDSFEGAEDQLLHVLVGSAPRHSHKYQDAATSHVLSHSLRRRMWCKTRQHTERDCGPSRTT